MISIATCALATLPLCVSAQSVDSTQSLRHNRERSAGAGAERVADRVSELPISTLSQLLAGRFPGLEVTGGGATGTGSRIRIRGQSSLLLGNEPLIVVDGVRLYTAPNNAGVAAPSRNDDINISDIESIELVKGPEATLRYGTGAANGVISIVTKRGARGRPRFEFSTQNGTLEDVSTYNDLYTLWGKRTGSTASVPCRLNVIAAGTCTADSLSHGNVMNIDSLRPIAIGYHNQYQARLSGGSRRVQYSLSGEFERETGVYKMPVFEQQRLETERGVASLPDDQTRPSSLARNSVQANVRLNPFAMLHVQLSGQYLDGDTHLVVNEGQNAGIGFNAYGGTWNLGLNDSRGVPLRGYTLFPAGDVMSQGVTQRIHRLAGGASAQFRPVSWFEVNATFGQDNSTQRDKLLDRTDEGPIGDSRLGYVQDGKTILRSQTANISATASRNLLPWLTTATSVGLEWISDTTSTNSIVGSGLPAGATSPDAESTISSTTNGGSSRTSALFAEEVFGVAEQLFVTGGVRRDQSRLPGVTIASITYPTIGASWLASKSLLRNATWLDTLRVRSAYATSGSLPGADNSVLAFAYAPATLPVGGNSSALRPEYATDVNAGVDASIFGGATFFSFTHYRRDTKNGLVPLQSAPSLGGSETQLSNGLRVANTGIEVAITQRFFTNNAFSASLSVNAWANRNRITSYPSTAVPFPTGNRNTQLNTLGYPLFGLWGRTYSYNDANHDGIITATEMTFSDTAQFIAPSLPTRELTAFPVVELLNHKLRFAAQIDSKWGFKKFNNTLRHQCATIVSCRAAFDPSASLESQAAAVAAQSNSGILTGFYDDASFVRLREASIVYELPARWASAIHASSWNVVLTGRNLALHTKYKGTDPETVSSTTDAGSDEYFATPPSRYYLARFNFVF
jgi:outer membrane receptor protein involved in Fe transport